MASDTDFVGVNDRPRARADKDSGSARAGGDVFPRAGWVKSIDKPTLAEINSAFGRFSGADMFQLYPSVL